MAIIAKIEGGQSRLSAAKEIGVDESVVRRWMNKKESLKSSVGGRNVNVRKTRKLGSGKKAAFPILEERLVAWVHDRNSKGLRVKDKFTFTPIISAAGDIVASHLLFSNLKNPPKVQPGCLVDINKTGMWNDKKRFKAGKLTESMVEIYAVANLKKLNIRITSLDEKWSTEEVIKFGEFEGGATMNLISFENIFGRKI